MGSFRRTPSILLFGFALGLMAPALVGEAPIPAASAKKKKKKSKKSNKANEAKKDAAPAAAPAPEEAPAEEADTELRTTGPARLELPVTEKAMDLSAKADGKRDETIAEIKQILPKVTGEQKGELVFRLAELYWEKSKFIYQSEFKDFDTTYQDWVDNGRQGKEPKLEDFTSKSEAYKKQALSNYAVVLKDYPEYPRLDEVLYIMAYNEYQAGKNKEAVQNYSKLIRQYPSSDYVADSYLALGEHYFAANKLPQATKAYGKAYDVALEREKPSVYRYAQYKLAWCDYNAQEYDKALKRFKSVVDDSERAEARGEGSTGDGKRDAVQLKREALNDMVLTYSQLDQVEDAHAYLKKKAGGDESFRLTTKLAMVYDNQGKHKQQVQTLRLLINLNPDHVSAPDFQSQIVQAYSKLGNRQAVRKEVTRMVELYRPGSSWWRKNEGNESAVERARTLAEQRMRELVTEYHRFAQKFKNVDDYELARDLYGQYLQAFPDSEQAYELSFYYAEILWDLGQWQDAAEQYDAVVARDTAGRYTRDCAYNAILAWEKIVAGEKPPERSKDGKLVESKGGRKAEIKEKKVVLEEIKKGKDYTAQKIPFAEERLAKACDAYVQVVPETLAKKDPKLADELIVVKFKSAYTYHRYYHFDEAAERFGELIRRWPTSDYARRGADSILDSYAAREQWVPLEKWSREFAANDPLMKDGAFSKSVNNFMQGASFKATEEVYQQAKALEKKKDKKTPEAIALYEQSARRFEGFVAEFPKSEYAPIALFNAMQIHDGASMLDLALASAQSLLEQYPKEINEGSLKENNVEEKLRLNLVRYYQSMADYPTSAKVAVDFVDRYPKHEKSPDVLYDSGVFFLGLGDTTSAVKSFMRYIKEYPKQSDIPDVFLRMATVYEDTDEWVKAANLYDSFEKNYGKQAKPDQILASRYKTALMLSKAGREDQSLEVCQGLLKSYKREELKKTETGQLAGGYCAFKVLEPEWVTYSAIAIESTETGRNPRAMKKAMEQVRSSLDLKKKKMEEMARKYVEVLEYGNGEWGVAGLYRAAQSLLEYVDTLRNAPDPPALANNFDALDIFRAELDNIAFPVEDEAIRALEQALGKAFELGIYSEHTLAIQETLKQFRPGAFGDVHELPYFPSAAGGDATTSAQTARR
jgi:TolA-binding protein